MAWVKLDDHFAEHPKIATAGPLAGWLHVCALCYCNRHLTDGFIPARVLGTLVDFTGINDEANGEAKPKQLASVLLAVGLWEAAEGGYLIHDYLDYNPSRDEVIATREKRAEAGRIGGKRSGLARNEAKPKQNASNVPSKPGSKTEAKPNPVPVPVPVPPVSDETGIPPLDPPKGSEPAKPEPKPKKRKTAAPDSFPITEDMYEYGAKQGLTRQQVEAETEAFLLHHRARGNMFVEWDAAWQGWMRRAPQYARNVTPFNGNRPTESPNGEPKHWNGAPLRKSDGLPTAAFFAWQASTMPDEDQEAS